MAEAYRLLVSVAPLMVRGSYRNFASNFRSKNRGQYQEAFRSVGNPAQNWSSGGFAASGELVKGTGLAKMAPPVDVSCLS
jgi:hypothetical protein